MKKSPDVKEKKKQMVSLKKIPHVYLQILILNTLRIYSIFKVWKMPHQRSFFFLGRWPLPNIYQMSSDVPTLNYWLLYWIIFQIHELHLSLTLHTLILAWKLHWDNVEITWIKSIRWRTGLNKSKPSIILLCIECITLCELQFF